MNSFVGVCQCIGMFHPKHRAEELHYEKKRRNNRILSKFYDAKYVDIRDGVNKSGSQLSCGRTNRRESRRSEKNERVLRGKKCSTGRISIRTKHYPYQPGDVVLYQSRQCAIKGAHCNGARVILVSGKSVRVSDVTLIKKEGGWRFLPVQA